MSEQMPDSQRRFLAHGSEVLICKTPAGVRVESLWRLSGRFGKKAGQRLGYARAIDLESAGLKIWDSAIENFTELRGLFINPREMEPDWRAMICGEGEVCLDKNARLGLCNGKRARVGDLRVQERLSRGAFAPDLSDLPEHSLDMGWLYGFMLANGSYHHLGSPRLLVDCPDIREKLERILKDNAIPYAVSERNADCALELEGRKSPWLAFRPVGKDFRRRLVKLFEGFATRNSHIPQVVFNSGPATRLAFIAGMAEGAWSRGCREERAKKGEFCFAVKGREKSAQAMLLLQSMKIDSRRICVGESKFIEGEVKSRDFRRFRDLWLVTARANGTLREGLAQSLASAKLKHRLDKKQWSEGVEYAARLSSQDAAPEAGSTAIGLDVQSRHYDLSGFNVG